MGDESQRPPPKRHGTVIGDRGEMRRTPGRGVPIETLPPVNQDFDFETGTPPAMDPHTYRAIRKLRNETLAADAVHAERLTKVEDQLVDVTRSHDRMEGAFSVMTTAIADEREEKKKQAEHWRRIQLKVFGGLFSSTVLAGVIALIARNC